MGFFQHFFQGRNGADPLGIFLLAISFALNIASRWIFPQVLSLVAYVLMGLCLFRMISRNIEKRQQENAWFMHLTRRFHGGTAQGPPTRAKKDRANYRYLKCPGCRLGIRVPRGRGNIRIICPSCGYVFDKRV